MMTVSHGCLLRCENVESRHYSFNFVVPSSWVLS